MKNISTIENKNENKEFVNMLITICLPIIFQNFISVLVNLIDTVMVAKLGDVAIASVGLSNQVFFVLNLIMLGVASGIAVFMAQYWGKRDYDGLQKSLVFGLAIVVPTMLVVIVIAQAIPETVLSIFTTEKLIITNGAKYLRTVCLSYLPIAISILLSYALRSTDRIKYAVYITFVALLINVILNYFLIFGIWIFPELGIVGAAIATNIARYIQVVLLILIIYIKKLPIAIKSLAAFRLNTRFIKMFSKTSGIVLLNETLYGAGAALLFAVFGRMGMDIVAGANIAKTIENLIWIFFWSFCAAASVSIGKLIGAEQYKKAQRYANKFIVTGFASGVLLSILLYSVSAPLLLLFDVSSGASDTALLYLNIFAIFIVFRGPLKILTGGVLRAGGDTGFVLLWDVIPLWIALAVCYYSVTIYSASTLLIFLLAIGYEIVKLIPTLVRVRKGKWINNLVK